MVDIQRMCCRCSVQMECRNELFTIFFSFRNRGLTANYKLGVTEIHVVQLNAGNKDFQSAVMKIHFTIRFIALALQKYMNLPNRSNVGLSIFHEMETKFR